MSRSISIPLTLIFVGLCVLPACVRKLEDQPCPCTGGWTCCVSQNRCLPADVPNSCPGDDPTPVVLPEICTTDGWCGARAPLTNVWGTADDDIWVVVGLVGGVSSASPMHFDGTAWSPMTLSLSPDQETFAPAAIWGTGSSDVFLAGSDGIAHYNGSTWKWQDSEKQFEEHSWAALGGTTPTDVWAVGASFSVDLSVPGSPFTGLVGHYDGTQWVSQLIPNIPLSPDDSTLQLTSVWAASATDAWTVGVGGTILRWDGSQWNARPALIDGAPVTQNLLGVWGSGEKDVWVVGRGATLLHFDGSAWSRPNIDTDLLGGLGATGALRAVWGTGPRDVWFAGDGGVLIHWDGNRWSAAPTATAQPLNALWKSPRGDVWAVGGDATAVHGLGGNWIATPPAPLEGLPVTAIRANSENDIWVAGSGLVRHWDGQSWLACDAQDSWRFERIQIMGPNDALLVGSGVGMKEYAIAGGACQVTGSGSGTSMDMHDIWANAPNDIWAVGAQGTVQHFDGASWSDVAVPTTADVVAVWGSPTDVLGEPIYVWALTGGDTAIRWDQTSWTVISGLTGLGTIRPGVSWNLITGTGPTDTWVFGKEFLSADLQTFVPISRHWNGTAWSRGTPDDEAFGTVEDSWAGDWLAGKSVFRLGELGWAAESTGEWGQLVGIANAGSVVWVLGQDGVLMHRPFP